MATRRFIIRQGEEITERLGTCEVHVNASNACEPIHPSGGASVYDVLQNNVNAIRAQRERTGQPILPHINHPNCPLAGHRRGLDARHGR